MWPRKTGSAQQIVWRQGLNPTSTEPYCSNPLITERRECITSNRWMPDVECYNVDCGTVATLCTNPRFTTKEECEARNTWQQPDISSDFALDALFEPVDVFGTFAGLTKGDGAWMRCQLASAERQRAARLGGAGL